MTLSHEGNRVENRTQITNISSFSLMYFDGFYQPEDPSVQLPKFAEWSAKEQFDRGLWNADTVAGARFPLVDTKRGLVMAYALYQLWTRAKATDVKGVGKIIRLGGEDRIMVSLCMTEFFKIKDGQIFDMDSVWFVGPVPILRGW